MPAKIREYLSMIRSAWRSFRDGRDQQVAAVMALHLTSGLVALGIATAWVAGVTGLEVEELSAYVHDLIGPNAAGVFDNLLHHAHLGWRTWVPVAAVVVVLLWNIVGVMRIVQRTVDTAVGVEPDARRGHAIRIVLERIAATAFVGLVSIALAASFSAKTALEVFDYLGIDPVAASPWAFRIVEVILALLLATVLFGGVFGLLSDTKVRLHAIVHGAFWAAKLYTLAQILAAFAIVYVGGLSFYGEASILLILLGYLYFAAASFLWGARVLRVQLTASEEYEPSPHASGLLRRRAITSRNASTVGHIP